MNPHESPSPIARCRGTMALLLAGPPAAAAGGEPFRARPAYAECALTSPPDAAAILRRAGAPGPAEGQLLLSVCADKTITAPATCRIDCIDALEGEVIAICDPTVHCGHAGGLAFARSSRVSVSDTDDPSEVDLAVALEPGAGEGAVVRQTSLALPLRDPFPAYQGRALWGGAYEKPGTGRVWRSPLAAAAAAFDGGGMVWSVSEGRARCRHDRPAFHPPLFRPDSARLC